MKPFQLILIFFGTLLIFPACQTNNEITDKIGNVNKQFMDAYSKGNAKGLSSCYTSEAKVLPQNREMIEGQTAIVSFWEEAMHRGITKVELETIHVEGIGKTAYEEGLYRIYLSKDKAADIGKYVTIWKKEKGQWKMHLAIWNTNQPSSDYRLPDLLR